MRGPRAPGRRERGKAPQDTETFALLSCAGTLAASIKSNVSPNIARNSWMEVFGLGDIFLWVDVRVDVARTTKNASSSEECGPARCLVGLGRAEAVARARGSATRL